MRKRPLPRRRLLPLTGAVLVTLGTLAPPGAAQPAAVRTGDSPGTIHADLWPRLTSPLPPDPALEKAIGELMAKMTLEEKVGQVLQPSIQHVSPADVRTHHLGSVLNGGGGWPGDVRKATPRDWLALADALWEASMDTSDGKPAIPIIWGSDAVHGHNNIVGATLFPHNVGLGAMRNPELVRRIGEVTAAEMAITGLDWNFSPTVAVARDDRWGRAYESWSEDPALVRSYAAAMIEGLQGKPGTPGWLGPGKVIATSKHFLGDGGTDAGKDQGNNLASEEQLRDVHLQGYVGALGAGVQAVMASYNSWHGQKLHGHRALLTDVLRGRLDFDGLVVGDWNGHGQLPGCTNASCAAAFNAGVDMFMVPEDWKALYENTLAQVRSGEIAEARLDEAVRRILRVKMRAGLFGDGKPSARPMGGDFERLGSAAHREVARQAVRESLVLLKNNGSVLPLRPDRRVLVAGDGADDVGKQSGGWTLSWQGTGNSNADFPGATSIWAGIRAVVEAAGGRATLSADGSFTERPDVAIVVYGENPYAEFEGDRPNVLWAGERELALLRRLGEAGVPVVSVFLSGRPLWVNPHLNASDAFVAAWLPGTEGGGIAEVLFTKPDGGVRHDFRGKLSFSWPKRATQAVLNQGDPGYDPLFPLGHGLTYAQEVEVPDLSVDTSGVEAVAAQPNLLAGTGFLTEAGGEPVQVTGLPTASPTGVVTVEPLPANAPPRPGAHAARWSGEGAAEVYSLHPQPLDLSRQSNGDLAVAFEVLVAERPTEAVILSMGCGQGCGGGVDVADLLRGLPPGEWQSLRVRLRCFAEAGADMTRIEVPVRISTAGRLTLAVAGVELVPATGELECPPRG
jgi:beta-glucosidase